MSNGQILTERKDTWNWLKHSIPMFPYRNLQIIRNENSLEINHKT